MAAAPFRVDKRPTRQQLRSSEALPTDDNYCHHAQDCVCRSRRNAFQNIEASVGEVIIYDLCDCPLEYVHLDNYTQVGGIAPLCHLWRVWVFFSSSSPHAALVIGWRWIGGYFSARRGDHCMLPLGPTPAPAIMNVFFILLINGAGPPPFSRVISLWLYGMSTWAPEQTGDERRACKAAKG